jgi:hypothetical protein
MSATRATTLVDDRAVETVDSGDDAAGFEDDGGGGNAVVGVIIISVIGDGNGGTPAGE